MKKISLLIRDDSGAVAMLTVITLLAFVGLLAVVIDLGHLHTVQGELRNAADACALRGARAFLPDDIPTTGVYDAVDPDPDNAKQETYNTIQVNKSDNTAFQLGDLPIADIQVGIWDYVNRTLLPWQWPPDPSYWGKYIGPGVSLPTKRAASMSQGPVSMTLANIFGISTVPVNVMATAALSGVGKLEEGYPGSFPIAVDEDKVIAAGDDKIFFSPDTPDVGGWTSLSPDTASAAVFKGLVNHTIPNPEVHLGDTIALQNGVACSVIKEAIQYYNTVEESTGVYKLVPPVDVVFPVVQVDTFNQSAEVTGYMGATLTYFRDSNAPKDILIPNSDPPKYTGDCMVVFERKDGSAGGLPGGGAWYGLLSPYPKLVQ